jgi:peptide/nickel transport system permease protein
MDFFYVDAVPAVTGSLLLDSLMAGRLDVFWNAARHLVMPAAVLGLSSMAYITRMVRNAMIYQLSQEYIITAMVKGVSYKGILWRHAFKNVLVQVVTIVALSYGFALEGAVLTETIFGWPGIGSYAAQSLFRADMNGILGVTLLIGLVFIFLNTATDAIYRLIDPRVA